MPSIERVAEQGGEYYLSLSLKYQFSAKTCGQLGAFVLLCLGVRLIPNWGGDGTFPAPVPHRWKDAACPSLAEALNAALFW